MIIKLKHVQGEVGYDAMWISKKFNNGDWNYWLVLEIKNLKEFTGDEDVDEYLMDVSVVSPEAAGEDNLKSAMDSFGSDDEDFTNEEDKVVLLAEYGIKATLLEKTGNNHKKLMKEGREEMEKINMLFGFYMDKSINRIGNTGWDFVSGNIGYK